MNESQKRVIIWKSLKMHLYLILLMNFTFAFTNCKDRRLYIIQTWNSLILDIDKQMTSGLNWTVSADTRLSHCVQLFIDMSVSFDFDFFSNIYTIYLFYRRKLLNKELNFSISIYLVFFNAKNTWIILKYNT